MNSLFDMTPMPRGPQSRGAGPLAIAGREMPAPHSGGATSRAAASEIRGEAKTQRRQVLAYLIGRGVEGATDEEMQIALGMAGNTQRPRRRELEKLRLIEPRVIDGESDERHPEGKHPVTRLTQSGREAVVWFVTTEGKATETATTSGGGR